MDKLAAALRPRPGRAAAAQRAGAGRRPAHRSGHQGHAAGRRGDPRVRRPARCRPATADDVLARPGGAGRTAEPGDVRRGVGFAVGFKNLMYAEGFDDYSTARVPHRRRRRHGHMRVRRGRPGLRHARPADRPRRCSASTRSSLAPADTSIGSAGSTSASRQTWMSGGAVEQACRDVRAEVFADVARRSRSRRVDARRGRRPRSCRRRRVDVSVRRRRCRRRVRGDVRVPPRRRRIRSTPTARATRTSRSPSPRTAPSSTSTPSSAWCGSCTSRPRRTSAGSSTRCRQSARSRAASPRASAWR